MIDLRRPHFLWRIFTLFLFRRLERPITVWKFVNRYAASDAERIDTAARPLSRRLVKHFKLAGTAIEEWFALRCHSDANDLRYDAARKLSAETAAF